LTDRHFVVGRAIDVIRPVIQAPIASLASIELVAAVSSAGGIGSLALTWTDARVAAGLVAAVKARTQAPFVANFVLSFKPTALTAVLEAGVPIVTFSWGLPGPLVKAVHSFGAVAGVQIGAVDGARRALDEGCDFLICQGIEAGGHVQSSTPLHALLEAAVAEAKGVPVVAAGGLADGADIAKVISLGASAAMLGTRFVASTESFAHPAYKAAILSAGADDTALTGCFDGGWPYALHRVLRNATLTEWEATGCAPSGSRPGESDVVARQKSGNPVRRYDDTPPDSEMHGDVLSCCLYAGTGVDKITELRSAGALVKELWRDASAILEREAQTSV
jgi:nitronate monooxygenase